MTRRPRLLLASLSLLLLACPAEQVPPPAAPISPAAPTPVEPTLDLASRPTSLTGALVIAEGRSLEWLIQLTGEPERLTAAKLWIPAQGVTGQSFDEVEDRGDEVVLRWKQLGVEYTIVYGDALACRFTQMSVSVDCEVEAIAAEEFAEATTPKRPQEPKPPFPYASEELEIANPQAQDVSLAATLTLPEGPGPHPAVVLISGSGPQDRDESLLGHKPFWVLADHLTRQGIAVLRYDDRGVGKSTGKYETATMVDFASDAWAALAYLRGRPDIDANKVGVIGHSEGGVVGPMVAAAHAKDVAFVVLLAGTGVDGSQIIRHQAELIGTAEGATAEDLAKDAELSARLHEAALIEPPEQAKAKLEALLREAAAELSPEELQALGGDLDKAIAAQIETLQSPWMRHFLAYDPAPTLKKLKMPVLAVFGERDLQVDPAQNRPPIEKALARNKRAKIVVLPGLNHLFQPAHSGAPSEYAMIETTLDTSLLSLVAGWIREQTGLADSKPSKR